MFSKTLNLVLLAFCCLALGAAKTPDRIPQNPILSQYFVVPKDEATMRKIAEKFEVEMRSGNGFQILVPANQAAELLALAPDAKLVIADITAELHRRMGKDRAGWHNFDTVQTHLQKIVTEHPDLASVEKYGESMEHRPLNALRLLSKVK